MNWCGVFCDTAAASVLGGCLAGACGVGTAPTGGTSCYAGMLYCPLAGATFQYWCHARYCQ